MLGKFERVPIEDDTKIIFSTEASLGKYKVLYQKWYWEGVTAESIIFDSQDVTGLSDSEIMETVKTSPLLKENTEVTLSRSDSAFVFVNFNFVV